MSMEPLLSDEHFSVGGTLQQVWASHALLVRHVGRRLLHYHRQSLARGLLLQSRARAFEEQYQGQHIQQKEASLYRRSAR